MHENETWKALLRKFLIFSFLVLNVTVPARAAPPETTPAVSALVAEACPCSRDSSGVAWKNHGQYVACVSHALQQITKEQNYFRTQVQATAVEAARSACGKETAAEQTVPVTIAAFYETLEAPAQAGAQVYVDGVLVGETDAAGQLVIDLPVGGGYSIRVVEPALVAGQTQLAVPADAADPYRVEIIMDSEQQLLEPASLVSQDITGPVLPVNTSVLRVGFVDDSGAARPLVDKGYVDLVPLNQPDAKREVTGAFTLNAEGALELTDANAFRSALYAMGLSEAALRVSSARDATNRIYGGELRFYVGRYSVTGHLSAPPSNPDLPLAGLTVTATYLPDPDVKLETTADATGGYSFSFLPMGNWEFRATAQEQGTYYNGVAAISVVGNRTVNVNLLGVADLISGASAVSTFQALSGGGLTAERGDPRRAEIQQALPPAPQNPLTVPSRQTTLSIQAATATTASVSVWSGYVGSPVTGIDILSVPQGTQKVYLNYYVFTYEYPYYVLQQSVFNDIWRIGVVAADGQNLFDQTRQVNSQLYLQPIWQANGSTGTITHEIDVSALTQAGDTSLILFASSTNIGDSWLSTWVTGSLTFEEPLRITAVEPDTVTPTRGDSSYYSIPRSGAANAYERNFTVRLARPQNSTITNVKVDLLRSSNRSVLQTIVDEAPGGAVTEIDPNTLQVRVSYNGGTTSSIASVPPSLHNIVYRFTVTASDNGVEQEDNRDSAIRHALWRAPATLARFGTRDTGLDDWAAKGTYEWLVAQSDIMGRTAVNDISGEHARNIGHSTHEQGTDIDVYHFEHLLTGDRNGTLNYLAIRSRVLNALGGDANARTAVSNWITTHRDEYDGLAAMNTVAQVITPNGGATTQLPDGWMRRLMTTGQLTDNLGNALDLQTGAWSQGKVRYANDHNNHIHFDLTDSRLNNNP